MLTPKEAVPCKPKGAFQGKLSHTSPVPNQETVTEKKITVYFSPTAKVDEVSGFVNETETEESAATKSVALQKVFGRTKGSPDKLTTEEKQPTPHKIQFKAEEDTIYPKEEKLSEVFEADGACDERKVKALKAKRKLNVNQSLNQDAAPTNHKLTEYFTVRRSVRKPKTAILEEKQRNLEEAVLSGKEDGLRVHNFPGKGRGIIATRMFRRGEFVVEYSGDLIDLSQARNREKMYAADQNTGCYMYYFQHKNQSYCVDATAESPRLGRLVNHSRTQGNLIPKVIEIKDRPYLLLVARVDISPGEELLYDYGDRSKISLKHHPWLAT